MSTTTTAAASASSSNTSQVALDNTLSGTSFTAASTAAVAAVASSSQNDSTPPSSLPSSDLNTSANSNAALSSLPSTPTYTNAPVASSSTTTTPATTTSIVVLPTTSSASTNPSSSGTTATATLLAAYRCYRHIPFALNAATSSAATSSASSENAQHQQQQQQQQQSGSDLEPESKRFKSGILLGGTYQSIGKDKSSVYLDSGGDGCSGSSGYAGENSSNSIYMVHKKLEERIGGILCCTVCLDLPKTAIYQCTNGHLMCAGCFSHLLADARLKDEQATCPNCRCEISKTSCCRNLAVEKTLSELPASCAYCELMLARHALDHHQREECFERPTRCVYECIGCTWEGPYHELDAHARQCAHPNRPAREIIEFIKAKQAQIDDDQSALLQLSNFLSFEKVCFNDLQFKQYKTDEITPKLYFETNRFNAFFYQWVLKARVNDNMKSPNLTSNRYISFQLILKSRLSSSSSSSSNSSSSQIGSPTTFDVKFGILRGPFGEVPIRPRVHSFEFNGNKLETDYIRLCIDPDDCNKFLASKTINFRFFMFQP